MIIQYKSAKLYYNFVNLKKSAPGNPGSGFFIEAPYFNRLEDAYILSLSSLSSSDDGGTGVNPPPPATANTNC